MQSFVKTIKHDHFRVYKSTSALSIFKHVLLGESFKYIFWLRLCTKFRGRGINKGLYLFCRFMLSYYKYKFGISISDKTEIGSGFYIGHFSGIFISPDAVIGTNCNISQGVTIGKVSRGEKMGTPVIGNNVYIAPGAKLIGGIHIGNNVAIGANAVVVKDIPDNVTVGGIPAKYLSDNGSEAYINNVDCSE
jgi:serine O-acetyltransferase